MGFHLQLRHAVTLEAQGHAIGRAVLFFEDRQQQIRNYTLIKEENADGKMKKPIYRCGYHSSSWPCFRKSNYHWSYKKAAVVRCLDKYMIVSDEIEYVHSHGMII